MALPDILHVFWGDCAADAFRSACPGAAVALWRDPVCDGPAPATRSDEEWREVRADWYVSQGWVPTREAALADLRRGDAELARFAEFAEAVLWFDACLFDQAILVRHLDWFSRRSLGATRLSLICVGEYPGGTRFRGLGELSTTELAGLLPQRQPVIPAMLELGSRAWAAFRSPDPRQVEAVVAAGTACLPYLGPALRRHLERFPSQRDGLDRLEREIVETVRSGISHPGRLFNAVSEQDHPPFFGDVQFFAAVDGLAAGPRPLLTVDGPAGARRWASPLDAWTVRCTPVADGVLAGEADWIALRGGIDRWVGGVHLRGAQAAWRWDAGTGRLRQAKDIC